MGIAFAYGYVAYYKFISELQARRNSFSLPNELYSNIFAYVPVADLCRLNLVCRKWSVLLEDYCARLDLELIFPHSIISRRFVKSYYGMDSPNTQSSKNRRLMCILTSPCPFQKKYSLLDRAYLAYKEYGIAYMRTFQIHQTHIMVEIPQNFHHMNRLRDRGDEILVVEPVKESYFALFTRNVTRPDPRSLEYRLENELKILEMHPQYQLPSPVELRIFAQYYFDSLVQTGTLYNKYPLSKHVAALTSQSKDGKYIAVKLNGDLVSVDLKYVETLSEIMLFSSFYVVSVIPMRIIK